MSATTAATGVTALTRGLSCGLAAARIVALTALGGLTAAMLTAAPATTTAAATAAAAVPARAAAIRVVR
jgi:hypothetical protein